jgi:methanesulfonate monooxygenase large subunit
VSVPLAAGAGECLVAVDSGNETPSFPNTHFVDTRVYTDPTLFREEQVNIFAKTWIIACHESELPSPFDYRTFRHPAGPELVVLRGDDGAVRAFYNICPHRGNVLVHEPAGNAHKLAVHLSWMVL